MLKSFIKPLLLILLLVTSFSIVTATNRTQDPVTSKDDEVIDMTLSFEGNRVFTREQLMSAMKLDKAPLDPRMLAENLQRLRLFLGTYGYIRPIIEDPVVSEITHGGTIKIHIEEGVKYRFGKIKVEGASAFSELELIELSGMKTGEIANSDVIRAGVFDSIRAAYLERGYIQATTDLTQEFHNQPNSDEGIVDFTINVDEGNQFRVHSINFKGCSQGTEKILSRLMLLKKGDVYNQRLLDLSKNRIIDVNLVEVSDGEDWADLLIKKKVKEVEVVINVKSK